MSKTDFSKMGVTEIQRWMGWDSGDSLDLAEQLIEKAGVLDAYTAFVQKAAANEEAVRGKIAPKIQVKMTIVTTITKEVDETDAEAIRRAEDNMLFGLEDATVKTVKAKKT